MYVYAVSFPPLWREVVMSIDGVEGILCMDVCLNRLSKTGFGVWLFQSLTRELVFGYYERKKGSKAITTYIMTVSSLLGLTVCWGNYI